MEIRSVTTPHVNPQFPPPPVIPLIGGSTLPHSLQVLSVRDAQSLLKDEEDLVIAVYDYWLAKRLRLGRALIPAVKHERRDGTSSSNPYLAFRKRTEKMQTRKVGRFFWYRVVCTALTMYTYI